MMMIDDDGLRAWVMMTTMVTMSGRWMMMMVGADDEPRWMMMIMVMRAIMRTMHADNDDL